MPSQTVEDYLKQILTLQGEGGEASVGDLARHLGVTSGTVTTMVKRLTGQKLVASKRYGGVKLTAKGERVAVGVLRRHRLIETFLVRTLGVDWSEVHAEAERLEHALSDRLLDRIDEFLGRPAFDPHGDPIPDAAGGVRALALVPLSDLAVGEKVQVGRIMDQDPAFLKFIEEHGLKPGGLVVVERVDPSADSMVLRVVGGKGVTMSRAAGGKILAEAAKGKSKKATARS